MRQMPDHDAPRVMTPHAEPIEPRLRYSIAQAGRMLGLSRATIYERVADGKLRMHKDGGRTFIARDEIVRYARTCDGYGA